MLLGAGTGVCLLFSRTIYDAIADVPFKPPIHPDVTANRLYERELALRNLHKLFGSPEEKIAEFYRKQVFVKENITKRRELLEKVAEIKAKVAREDKEKNNSTKA